METTEGGKPRRVLITGVSGYIGSALCRALAHAPWCERIDGCDLRPPLDKHDKLRFAQQDVTAPGLADWVAGCAPDALVHLAFVVEPIHDEALMERINVGGTRAALEAAGRAGTPQVLVASSATAYGAWPDNPVPLREDHPIRPHTTFQYAREKAEVERLCARFAAERPEVALSVIRPCIVYGPRVGNYLSRLLTDLPLVVGLTGARTELQFVHEDDVAAAIVAILEQGARGPFNVAPPDAIPIQEVLEAPGKPVLRLPGALLVPLAGLLWRLRSEVLGAPAPFLDFVRHPWVVDSERLRRELGFRFRYSSRETLTVMLRSRGLLP